MPRCEPPVRRPAADGACDSARPDLAQRVRFSDDTNVATAGLFDIKTYADGIGTWKPQVMSLTGASGTFAGVTTTTTTPTALVADAHLAGLFVRTCTFRNEQKYLAGVWKGDPPAEYLAFFEAGVDGVFTDFANSGFAARATDLTGTGR